MTSTESKEPLVTVRCCTYNQEKFIRQTLDGFVMQQTNFPFEAIVHDDASTDGTAKIVLEYAEKYPDIIKPIIETENQYSKGDGSLSRIMNAHTKGKYVAFCEGDDYWTDPMKLQKQVDYMEMHPNCTMTCSRADLFSEKRKCVAGEHRNKKKSQILPAEEVITKGGGYIVTCSCMLQTKILLEKINIEYLRNCWVGDYPNQMLCALKGYIYYFDDKMVVYRVENSSSWSGKFDVKDDRAFKGKCSTMNMFLGLSKDFPRYKKQFEKACNKALFGTMHGLGRDKEKMMELKANYWNVMSFVNKVRLSVKIGIIK